AKGEKMRDEIHKAKEEGDSLGGTIECGIVHLPVGTGSPWFYGLESIVSSMVFAIPGVKGIEFGSGFEGSKMKGSKHNDAYVVEKGMVRTKSNHHGGILGGLSTGMPLIFHVACKPTASISLPQETVNLDMGEDCIITVKGRHDPCIVPRAVVCVEAATAIAMADQLMVEGVL
ncbi:MAG TPA: chorismate synthase, partial [Bacillota bacterium]|nr:chorismate synthase [Bacillota bacterium]